MVATFGTAGDGDGGFCRVSTAGRYGLTSNPQLKVLKPCASGKKTRSGQALTTSGTKVRERNMVLVVLVSACTGIYIYICI